MALHLESSDNNGINEINITPFVDIVLVLLIIFMISTPAMVYRGLRVALPVAAQGEDLSHVTLHLTLSKSGELYLDSKRIDKEGLKAAVLKLQSAQMPCDALINADRSLSHGSVMEIADLLKGLGVGQVGFGVEGSNTK